ncbi:hypothetical protein KP509_31G049900 [Ceratopteris richardii]|uniref:Uncharacterized protein n=1 Tax=Ceratopteris richardii TaxID=49495 RepID=A0A8T2QXW0_CERRI|nr:hypothetical protein KP509_31G049900 [Ceratopteris richardii]
MRARMGFDPDPKKRTFRRASLNFRCPELNSSWQTHVDPFSLTKVRALNTDGAIQARRDDALRTWNQHAILYVCKLQMIGLSMNKIRIKILVLKQRAAASSPSMKQGIVRTAHVSAKNGKSSLYSPHPSVCQSSSGPAAAAGATTTVISLKAT